jgi:hypothetical protein
MATELHDRLSELAGHTPAASPPPDLWRRGVRRRRVTLAGRVVMAALLVALVGVGGWTWHAARPVQPADTHGSPHLPDRFYEPSPWLPSFDGPPGQLVAVGAAPHKSLFHTREGLYGVTASTGEYGFLDLPDADPSLGENESVAVSPDGRYVAYWLRVRATGKPNGSGAGGVGVYDTSTGSSALFDVTTRHGLYAGGLLWADATTLAIDHGAWQSGGHSGGGATGAPPWVWVMGEPRPKVMSIANRVVDARRRLHNDGAVGTARFASCRRRRSYGTCHDPRPRPEHGAGDPVSGHTTHRDLAG